MAKPEKLIDDMKKAAEKQADLLEKLQCSMAVEKRFPGCFDHGSVKIRVIKKWPEPGAESLRLEIKAGDGKTYELDGGSEPETLKSILGNSIPTATKTKTKTERKRK